MSQACTAAAQPREAVGSLPDDVALIWQPQRTLESCAFHEWQGPTGECILRFHRLAQGYLLRFPDIADFILSEDGQLSSVQAVPGVDREILARICCNQVQPLSWSRQGRLVLHAGVVEVAERVLAGGKKRGRKGAVLFLGRSGAGKSTLVKAFADAGHRFLSDDCALFAQEAGGIRVLPGQAGVRLRRDSCLALMQQAAAREAKGPATVKAASNGKVFLAAGEGLPHCAVSRPVAAIYLLDQSGSDTVTITERLGREGLMALLEHSFLLDVEEPTLLRRHFGRLSSLLREASVFGLSYPRDYQCLPRVVDAVLRHVAPCLPGGGC